MAELHCVVVTPESTAIDTFAAFVALPLYDGEKGIGTGHAPFIGKLGSGELRIRKGTEVARYYVEGGFVQVTGNCVSIMTARVVASNRLEKEVLHEELKSVLERRATSDEALLHKQQNLEGLRAQIRLAGRSGVA